MVLQFAEAYTRPSCHAEEVNMLLRYTLVVLFVSFGSFADADAQPMPDSARGELLYSTHCIGCHSDKVHWRDKKLVRNFQSLRAEVRRWQKTAALEWSDDEISAVALYLNTLYYHYPAPY
jgi:mono/diheme cytochrome c family protein